MSNDIVNRLLERHAIANGGINYSPDFALYDLPAADSLSEALDLNFSQFSNGKGCEPAEAWNIRTRAVVDRPDYVLEGFAHTWFFGSPFSPAVSKSVAAVQVSDFIVKLRFVVGSAKVFDVNVSPPNSIWYDIRWKDFAFEGKKQRWLLHLGFSD